MTAIQKLVRVLDSKYRKWVKSQPCLIDKYHVCVFPVDPHHVVPDGGGKMGSKVSDYRCVPLCRSAHDLAQRSRDSFQMRFPVLFEAEIARLNLAYAKLQRKPKVAREPKERITVQVEHCRICHRTHKFPWSKVRGVKALPCVGR